MSNDKSTFEVPEAWMRFWADMMKQTPFAGMGAPDSASPVPSEMGRQMQRAFLDAWTQSCEQFLRSDAFLEMLKQSMDRAMAFRQQVNEFLRKGLQSAQAPSRGDTEDIMQFLHSFEERVLDQLQHLTKRVDAIENKAGTPERRSSGAKGAAKK